MFVVQENCIKTEYLVVKHLINIMVHLDVASIIDANIRT